MNKGIVLLILGLFLFTFCSAQQTPVGSWRFSIEESLSGSATSKVRYDSLPAGTKARIRESFGTRTMTFRVDQTAEIVWKHGGQEKRVQAEWRYDQEKGLIVLISKAEGERTFSVKTLSEQNLILLDPNKDGVFSELHFKRI